MLHIRNLEEGVELFKVLGSDIRVNIILLLLKEKEMNKKYITKHFDEVKKAWAG